MKSSHSQSVSVRIDPTQFVSTVRTACTAQSHSSQQCKRRPFLANIRDGDKWYLWFYITDHVPLNIINYTIIDILLFLSSYTDCRRVGSSRLHHHAAVCLFRVTSLQIKIKWWTSWRKTARYAQVTLKLQVGNPKQASWSKLRVTQSQVSYWLAWQNSSTYEN